MRSLIFLLLLLTIACEKAKPRISILSPEDEADSLPKSMVLNEVRGQIIDYKGKPTGEISCNGIAGQFTTDKDWLVKDVTIPNLDQNNLKCTFKEGNHTATDEITIHPKPILEEIIGEDLNNDGVRDDVQTYLNEQSYSGEAKTALIQTAKAFQTALTESSNKEKSIDNMQKIVSLRPCIEKGFSSFEDAYAEYLKLRARVLNSKERIEAFFALNEHMNGSSFAMDDTDLPCNLE